MKGDWYYYWLVTTACGRHKLFKKGTIVKARPPKALHFIISGKWFDVATIKQYEKNGYFKRIRKRDIADLVVKQ